MPAGRRAGAAPRRARAASRASSRDPQLLRLNYGIFALHAVLMALFTQVPFALRDNGPRGRAALDGLSAGARRSRCSLMLPFLRRVDQPDAGQAAHERRAVAILARVDARARAVAGTRCSRCASALDVFFAAFNLLEAMLPSLVSKYAPRDARGAAIGVNSSAQFLGAFAGAAAGGWLAEHAGDAGRLRLLCLALDARSGSPRRATMAAPPRLRNPNYSMGET